MTKSFYKKHRIFNKILVKLLHQDKRKKNDFFSVFETALREEGLLYVAEIDDLM